MRKPTEIVLLPLVILGWILGGGWETGRAAAPTPTAPPPPVNPTATRKPPVRKTKTPTPTERYGGPWYTRTPSPTATLTGTITLTPTATITPTATPIPTYLHIQVYMDSNANRQFDLGEGIDDLVVVATSADWQSWATTHGGQVTFLLPPEMEKDTPIDVEAPYLHWSLVVNAPELGGTARGELQLALPEFPSYLP